MIVNFARKAQLIQALLDHEYAFVEGMTQKERDSLDVERQSFALQMGWPTMSVEVLELHCLQVLGKVPD